jgi:hypothetical protein
MRGIHRLMILVVLSSAAAVATSSDAFAKPKPKPEAAAGAMVDPFADIPEIKPSTVAEFDTMFTDAAGIQGELKTSWTTFKGARDNLNTVLGVATDAPLATALADLQGKAAGKLKIAMKGTKPTLEPSEAVPENVQAGIDSVNKIADAGEATLAATLTIKDKAVSLFEGVKGFPMQIPTMLGKLTPDQAKVAPKIVGDNIKAIKAIPKQVEAIGKLIEATFNDVKTVFAAK